MHSAIVIPKFPTRHPFPVDSRNPKAWNDFWASLLGSEEDLRYLHLDTPQQRYRDYIELFRELSAKRIMFVGNGICVLPWMFEHCGFDVTSVDIAETAVAYCSNLMVPEAYYHLFFVGTSLLTLSLSQRLDASDYPVLSANDGFGTEGISAWVPGTTSALGHVREHGLADARDRISRWHMPGGTNRFDRADVFECEVSCEYDVVFALNLIEHFAPSDQVLLSEQLERLLAPGGILIVESQYLSLFDDKPFHNQSIEATIEKSGFRIHQKAAYVWRQAHSRKQGLAGIFGRLAEREVVEVAQEYQVRATAEKVNDLNQLRAGEKLAIFHYSR